MKIIDIEINENGNVQIETEGFSGKSCIEETQFLKDLLGKEKSRKLKPVYFTEKPIKNKIKIKG